MNLHARSGRNPKAGRHGLHVNRSSISAAFTAILCRVPCHHLPPLSQGRTTQLPVLALRFLFAREFSQPTMLLTASPLALFPGFPCARPRPQTKGKRNAERRVVTTRALRARGAPCGSARLSASHRGSCQGDSWSPRLSVRPCFGRQSGAFDPVRPPQPGRRPCAAPRALPAPN